MLYKLYTLTAALLLRPCRGFSPIWSLSNAMLASSQVNEADLAMSRSVTSGAELAMAECAAQFKNEVWNCPVTAFDRAKEAAASGGGGGWENNRETAYVHAIMSAGVTHTIARNCSEGSLTHCGCERNGRVSDSEAWKWGGCSDNVVFGSLVSRQFLDKAASEPGSLAAQHNNEAGRIAIKKTMRQLCKCHGVSGSCATQTCWRQLGNFRDVGKYLKKQYTAAQKVDYSNGVLLKLQNSRITSNRVERSRRGSRAGSDDSGASNQSSKPIKKRKLVFLQPSPNYCRMNPALGYKGVVGRSCIADPASANPTRDIRKCTELCSAYGLYARKEVVEVTTSCNCRFEWCCRISCDTCRKKQVIITCVERRNFDYKFIVSNST